MPHATCLLAQLSFTIVHITSVRRARAVAALLAAQPFAAFFIGQLRHDGLPMLGDNGGPGGVVGSGSAWTQQQILIARPKVITALGGPAGTSGRTAVRENGDDDGVAAGTQQRDTTATAARGAAVTTPASEHPHATAAGSATRSIFVVGSVIVAFLATLVVVARPLLRASGDGSSGGDGTGSGVGGAAVAPFFVSDVGPPVSSGLDYDIHEARALLAGAAEAEAAQQNDRFVGVAIGSSNTGRCDNNGSAGGDEGGDGSHRDNDKNEKALYYPAAAVNNGTRGSGIAGDDEDAI